LFQSQKVRTRQKVINIHLLHYSRFIPCQCQSMFAPD